MSRVAAGSGVTVAVTAAVLAAAVLHAGWNALLKGVGDRLATVVLLDLTGLALSALPLCRLRPRPAGACSGCRSCSTWATSCCSWAPTGWGASARPTRWLAGRRRCWSPGTPGWSGGERLAPVQLVGLAGVCAGLLAAGIVFLNASR